MNGRVLDTPLYVSVTGTSTYNVKATASRLSSGVAPLIQLGYGETLSPVCIGAEAVPFDSLCR
jgi:hypothetical protein